MCKGNKSEIEKQQIRMYKSNDKQKGDIRQELTPFIYPARRLSRAHLKSGFSKANVNKRE